MREFSKKDFLIWKNEFNLTLAKTGKMLSFVGNWLEVHNTAICTKLENGKKEVLSPITVLEFLEKLKLIVELSMDGHLDHIYDAASKSELMEDLFRIELVN